MSERINGPKGQLNWKWGEQWVVAATHEEAVIQFQKLADTWPVPEVVKPADVKPASA
jgi:hypothetical protein